MFIYRYRNISIIACVSGCVLALQQALRLVSVLFGLSEVLTGDSRIFPNKLEIFAEYSWNFGGIAGFEVSWIFIENHWNHLTRNFMELVGIPEASPAPIGNGLAHSFFWSIVWVSRCMGVWMSRCLGVWVFGCWVSGVWVRGCVGVWVSGCMRACLRAWCVGVSVCVCVCVRLHVTKASVASLSFLLR